MSGTVRLVNILVILGYVSSQGYFEEHRHTAHALTQDSIPKQFEIRDEQNPTKEFERYVNHIHDIANQENVTIVYKVKVEILKKFKQRNIKKYIKKVKTTKKFNIPLKKNSMKLSNFEVFLRKAAEENSHYPQAGGLVNYHIMTSTEEPALTTKMLHTKFKPIISKLNNFTKVIRPVRNRIVTLS